MKKAVLFTMIAILVLLGSQSLYGVEYGVKVGYSMAKMSTFEDPYLETEHFDYHSQNGFLAGFFLSVPVSRVISFQPEIMYTQKGANITDTFERSFFNLYKLELDLNYKYLEIPALFKVNFGHGGRFAPYLLAGPYVAFKLDASYFLKEETDLFGSAEVEAPIETAPNIDYGVVLGAGAELKSGNGSLLLEVRYSIGLRNAFENLSPTIGDEFKSKHSMLSFVVGYTF